MPEQIIPQAKHSYFARECSLTRNNPLHKIKIASVGAKKIYYYDLFHDDEYRDVRPSHFKSSLFGNGGLFLIQDLGDEDYVETPPPLPPPEIPEVPVKETFGDLAMKVFLKTNGLHFVNVDHAKGDELTMNRIWKLCLSYAGIDETDPNSTSSRSHGRSVKLRYKNYCLTRQIAQYLGCFHTTLTLKEVGYHTGRKDHTTVLSSRNKVYEYIQNGNKFVLGMIEYVRGEIKEGGY